MHVFRRIIFVAAIAGVLAGILVTVAHHYGTTALILRAELFEQAVGAVAHIHAHAAGTVHDHGAAARWAPDNGLERTAYTAMADIVTAIAFALLLVSAYELRGAAVGWREGMFWGLAGFASFTLAPCLGLPPEVPGTEAGPLVARQIWWIGTAAATAAGLGLMFLQRRPVLTLAGVILLFAPHLTGAPHPEEFSSSAPESLMHDFIVMSIMTSLLFWLALGTLTGFFYKAMGRHGTEQEAGSGILSLRH